MKLESKRSKLKELHPNRASTVMLSLIVILVLIIVIQTWLLYTSVNNALNQDNNIAIPAFIASTTLFLIGLRLLWFLPPKSKKR